MPLIKMNHPQAHNLLDQRKAGADLPQDQINQALFLTGDLSESELLRVNPSSQNDQTDNNWPSPSGLWNR